ncbi:ABC transporter substrate-binding protein [Amycolatopsis sp. FDAARGOS 1241]|uniref:ABC transporter substrate-binding protein n=1 Tax=Amycolatopsis sp. FDAARGOS 1241 TaxID=2778070 RepID=UPI001950207F|nr:ABC transporter substrate-binding protein [Amycolatopsis sp. FDAARGOS 1241]QRP47119.1 ABC transporter substrate-binding protein [Amycolatopsis sp. FDAARGOS 1241]
MTSPGRARRPRTLALVAAVATAAATLTACGSSGSSGDGLKIGVQFGLTGADAAFDAVYQDSAKLAFADLAKNGVNGHSVELLYADDASDPATAVTVARKYITQDKVSVLYGPAFTPTALSTMQVASSTKTPFYTPGSINPQLTTPLNKYTFAPAFSSNDVATGIAKLVHSMGAKKVGMMVESDAYGDAALSGAKAALAKYGLNVDATEKIAANATDATSQVQGLKDAGVDAVLLGITAPPMAAVINAEIHQATYLPMVTFAGSNTSLDQLAKSDPKVRYYALTPLACPVGDPCTADFMKAWKAEHPGTEPIVWTVQAYAAAKAFVAGLQNAKDTTPEGLITGLETMKPFKTPELPCPIAFSASSHKGNSCTNFYGISGGKVSFFGSDTTQNQLTAN